MPPHETVVPPRSRLHPSNVAGLQGLGGGGATILRRRSANESGCVSSEGRQWKLSMLRCGSRSKSLGYTESKEASHLVDAAESERCAECTQRHVSWGKQPALTAPPLMLITRDDTPRAYTSYLRASSSKRETTTAKKKKKEKKKRKKKE